MVTKKTAKFQVGDICVAANDIEVRDHITKKGTKCRITYRHLFSDCYDIEEVDNLQKWMMFVDAKDLGKA